MIRTLLMLCIGLFVVNGAWAYDRHVTIENESSSTITKIFGSNTGTSDWEEELLEGDALAPDESVEIDFDDESGYCMFDFLVVFADESEMEEEGFNVCDYGTFTITD